jgi:hypothetical protein
MRTFIVRLWQPTAPEVDSPATDRPELHGRVEDPITGLERSFESGGELIAIIGAWVGITAAPIESEIMGD